MLIHVNHLEYLQALYKWFLLVLLQLIYFQIIFLVYVYTQMICIHLMYNPSIIVLNIYIDYLTQVIYYYFQAYFMS